MGGANKRNNRYFTSTPNVENVEEKKRRFLKKELKAVGLRWQRRPKKRLVANQLPNEQAVQPLQKYPILTEIGGQEGGAEKRVEWEQRANQEREELFDSG